MPGLPIRVIVALVTIFPLMVGPAMSQPNCDFFKIVQDVLAKKFELTDLSYMHPVVSETDTIWTVRYELPPDSLGFIPVVGIDKRTCAVVHSDME